MTLELFTATGALVGGLVAFLLPERVLEILFGGLLVYTAVTMARRRDPAPSATDAAGNGIASDDAPDVIRPGDAYADPDADADPTRSSLADRMSGPGYRIHRLGFGVIGSLFAGVVSALLGIGGGLVKVPVMHVVMGVPLRVATATSNLMIGITAAASAVIYLIHGGIDPYVAGPTGIGVFIGATAGSRLGHRVDLHVLRLLFVVVLGYTAFQMLLRAVE
jgi:uncharacterized membrane protein YfcA